MLEIKVDLAYEEQFVYVTFWAKDKKSMNTFYSIINSMRQCKIELNQLTESGSGSHLKFYLCFHTFNSFIDLVFR